jgi:anti-sigma factor ChrR (cupin superfamily)
MVHPSNDRSKLEADMKPRMLLLLAVALAISIGAVVVAAEDAKKGVALTQAEMKWEDLPGRPGQKRAPLWGAPDGHHGELRTLPAKFQIPLHTHSATLRIVVVSGTFSYGLAGEPEKEYGQGSFILIPGGVAHHNGSPDGCLLLEEVDGKYDSNPVAATGR